MLTGEDKFAMQYDAAGNMIAQSSSQTPSAAQGGHSLLAGGVAIAQKAIVYDSYNRIVRVTNSQTSEVVGRYWYDDQGFRVRKVARRHIAGEDRQVEVLYPSMYFGLEKHKTMQGADIPNTTYSVNNIYLDGVRIAAVIPSGDARYYLTDQVDSVKIVADDDSRAVTRMEYMPYGATWFEEGDTNNAPKYNSQELDPESNFYYYNARHYSQEIARFVTADSVIDGEFDTQGWNRYAYCKNNPIEYKDPTGHHSGGRHKQILEESFKDEDKLSETSMKYLKKGNVETDKIEGKSNIDVENTRKHGMAGLIIKWNKGDVLPTIRYETKFEAAESSRQYMTEKINKAVESAKEGKYKEALESFGSATHTVQDRVEHDFAPWTLGKAMFLSLPEIIPHGVSDVYMNRKELEKNVNVTKDVWKEFKSKLIKDIGKENGQKVLDELTNLPSEE